MKPNTQTAMTQAIANIREAMPFHLSPEELCSGLCKGCPKKLLAFIDGELEDWEQRLDDGDVPNLKDITKLEKISRKVFKAMQKNNLV